MKSLLRGGLFSITSIIGISLLSMIWLTGCGSPPSGSSEDPPASSPDPTDNIPKINLAGTWERADGAETLVIGEDGTVLTQSLVLDAASAFRNVVPCDGQQHQLSSAPENGILSQLAVLIDPYKISIDVNQQITVDRHRFMEIWVTDPSPCVDMQISGVGQMLSETSMQIEYLKEPLGFRQRFTYNKLAN
jgi:hypothetical protein